MSLLRHDHLFPGLREGSNVQGIPLTHFRTPDGRYLVVRGRLWRAANPSLSAERREALVGQLMQARRQVKSALQAEDSVLLKQARAAVQAAKESLGERGPVWWTDGAKDFNRHMVKNSPYADWYRDCELT